MDAILILVENNIKVNEAIKLVQEYASNLDWFIPKLIREKEKIKLYDMLRKSDMHSLIQQLGTKKGNKNYNNWRSKIINAIEELNDSELNVFDRLRKKKGRKTNTLFDRLKYRKLRSK